MSMNEALKPSGFYVLFKFSFDSGNVLESTNVGFFSF